MLLTITDKDQINTLTGLTLIHKLIPLQSFLLLANKYSPASKTYS